MKVYLSAYAEIAESQVDLDHADPQFRKATRNMLAAYNVCEKSLASISPAEKSSVSVIVATYFGEVTSSLDFLTTLTEIKMAKPILFQNSLHNSTLGFVSIQLGLTGPAFTLSADEKTDEAVTHTAEALLGLTDHVLICYVDMVPDFLKRNYERSFPELTKHLGFARSLLLSKKENPNSVQAMNLADFNFSKSVLTLRKPN